MKWYYILEILIFLFLIIYLAGGTVLFTAKGYGFATVNGKSMYPTLEDGMKIIVKWKIPEGNLTGRILIFSYKKICHRCILDDGDWLSFKGDNSTTIERCTRNEVLGEFIKVCKSPFDVPFFGWMG